MNVICFPLFKSLKTLAREYYRLAHYFAPFVGGEHKFIFVLDDAIAATFRPKLLTRLFPKTFDPALVAKGEAFLEAVTFVRASDKAAWKDVGEAGTGALIWNEELADEIMGPGFSRWAVRIPGKVSYDCAVVPHEIDVLCKFGRQFLTSQRTVYSRDVLNAARLADIYHYVRDELGVTTGMVCSDDFDIDLMSLPEVGKHPIISLRNFILKKSWMEALDPLVHVAIDPFAMGCSRWAGLYRKALFEFLARGNKWVVVPTTYQYLLENMAPDGLSGRIVGLASKDSKRNFPAMASLDLMKTHEYVPLTDVMASVGMPLAFTLFDHVFIVGQEGFAKTQQAFHPKQWNERKIRGESASEGEVNPWKWESMKQCHRRWVFGLSFYADAQTVITRAYMSGKTFKVLSGTYMFMNNYITRSL